jgi:hypothetical protein
MSATHCRLDQLPTIVCTRRTGKHRASPSGQTLPDVSELFPAIFSLKTRILRNASNIALRLKDVGSKFFRNVAKMLGYILKTDRADSSQTRRQLENVETEFLRNGGDNNETTQLRSTQQLSPKL